MVAWSKNPTRFAGSINASRRRNPAPCELAGEVYLGNPIDYVDDAAVEMLRLWRESQGTGLTPGTLPEPGGPLEQRCIMLEAFEHMSRADRLLGPGHEVARGE